MSDEGDTVADRPAVYQHSAALRLVGAVLAVFSLLIGLFLEFLAVAYIFSSTRVVENSPLAGQASLGALGAWLFVLLGIGTLAWGFRGGLGLFRWKLVVTHDDIKFQGPFHLRCLARYELTATWKRRWRIGPRVLCLERLDGGRGTIAIPSSLVDGPLQAWAVSQGASGVVDTDVVTAQIQRASQSDSAAQESTEFSSVSMTANEQHERGIAQSLIVRIRNSWLTPVIIGINVLMFLMTLGMAEGGNITPAVAMKLGANAAIYTLRGEWWRLWTSTFVHFSFWHVALNMVALWQSGRVAEALYGRPRFAIIYLGAGGLGSLASALFHLQTVSAGASGAIFGVYGALFAFSLHRGGLVSKPMFARLRNVALIFCGVNLLNGLTQAGVDNAAHLGGLAGGLILGRLLYRPIDEEGPLREPWARPTIVALAASFVLLSLPVLMSSVLPKAPAIVSNSASESVPSNSHPNAGVASKPTPLPIPNSNAAEAAEDNLMGTRYRKGLTGEVNAAEAIRWFRKAADLGNPEAQYNLGDMYENGEGVSKSIAEALAWYTKAADHGESLAQDRLGHLYEGGLGIPKNSLEAIKWYTKAAEQGEVMDQYMLGELYSRGTDVPKNIAMATGWYRQAADQGFTAAQYRLREISGNGKRASN